MAALREVRMNTEPTSVVPAASAVPLFRQPKPALRWAGVVLACIAWYASFQTLRMSVSDASSGPLDSLLCGGGHDGPNGCQSVLRSPYARMPLSKDPNAPQLPVAVLGMAYFGAVLLWYLFVGPPTRSGRWWHLALLLVVLAGIWESGRFIVIMAFELHRWCGWCLVAHIANAGILIVTLLSWPWSRPTVTVPPHPLRRLALAAATAMLLLAVTHVALAYVMVAGKILHERTADYRKLLDDPAFIAWDHERQPVADLPLASDEVFRGDAGAPHTIVVFSDFQCTACRKLHETLNQVLVDHPHQIRIAYRHFPQDPECNPAFTAGGHAAACAAARAAEAARAIGGPGAYLALRDTIYEHQDELPAQLSANNATQLQDLFTDWAIQIGLDATAFRAAYTAAEVRQHVANDIELGRKLDLSAMPVVYLDGKRVRGWSAPAVWNALLGDAPQPTPASQPTP